MSADFAAANDPAVDGTTVCGAVEDNKAGDDEMVKCLAVDGATVDGVTVTGEKCRWYICRFYEFCHLF